MDVDLFAGAGAEQILLRFSHFLPAKNPHGTLGNREGAIGNGAIEVNRNRPSKAATFGTCA